MREFAKVMCVVVIMICGVWTALAWGDDHPTSLTKALRYILPAVCAFALIGFLAIHFRMDEAPDYLYQLGGTYFDRDGFCFLFDSIEEDGVCFIRAVFQNRRDTPCVGRIALRPAKDFISTAKIEAIGFEIECLPAAFGVAKVPVPLARAYQGKKQRFEVGASVEHPNDKGRTLRFRNGLTLRHNTDFKSKVITGFMVVGALAGSIVWYKPGRMAVTLPEGVSESVPPGVRPEVKTLWKLGDPELPLVDLIMPLEMETLAASHGESSV
jgi:hypothetical protein